MLRHVIWSYVARLCCSLCQAASWTFHLDLSVMTGDKTPETRRKANLSDLSDEELAHLCLERGKKDDRPFRELFQRHQRDVWRTCYRFVRNAHDAEDLTQETFFKAYRSLTQFEGRASFRTWLHRIAINTSQNELRRRARRPQVSQTPVETLAEVLPAEGTPETRRLEPLQQERLARSLARLRMEEFEVLQLREFDQRPYVEIAQILGVKLSAAKMRVQRARLALQAAYRQLEREEESL